jgi:hypothetical protein
VLSDGQSLPEIAVNHVDALYIPKQVPQINIPSGQNTSYTHRWMEQPVKNGNNTFYYAVTQNS